MIIRVYLVFSLIVEGFESLTMTYAARGCFLGGLFGEVEVCYG